MNYSFDSLIPLYSSSAFGMSSPTPVKIKGAYPSKKRPIPLNCGVIFANAPSRPSIGFFTRLKQFFAGTMLLASYRFGIRLKSQMDKGNLILRPTFSLALLARVSAPAGGNMQRWRFLVIRDAKIKEIVGPTTGEPGRSRLRRGIGLENRPLA